MTMTVAEAGRRGGIALNKKLTKEERSERARYAAHVRWDEYYRKNNKRKPLSKEVREKVFNEKGNKCWYCKTDLLTLPSRNRTVDHIKLICKGGDNSFDNLVPCCRSCNSTRHTMVYDEFIEYLELKKKNLSRMELWRERQKLINKYYG